MGAGPRPAALTAARRAPFASYPEAVGWAYSLAPRGIRLELDRIRIALKRLGSPEKKLKVIHIAGTNGKGSVAAMIEQGLRANGLRTGLYTSPHLHRFTERIQIDGNAISTREATDRLSAIRAMLAEPGAPELTFFEVATLLAFLCFRDLEVDVVVLEVGLGGRLDATNVIPKPWLTVITRIARDHEQYLGKTIPRIAGEKAGIIKRGVRCLSGVEQASARRVIAERAAEVGAAVATLGAEIVTAGKGAILEVTVDGASMTVEVPLPGAHQRRNAALAAAALLVLQRRLRLNRASSAVGIAETLWPGRLESIEGRPRVLLDAAHNPDGAKALARFLREQPETQRVLVFGTMRDKDWRAMLGALLPEVSTAVFCAPPLGRAEDPAVLAGAFAGCHVARDVPDALRRARRLAGKRGLVVVCGSIFVLAPARALVMGIESDPPIAM